MEIHRSAGMKCATCMAFVEKRTAMVQQADHVIGRCRRHAPTMQGFPVIWSDDWCLDHKLDETKLKAGVLEPAMPSMISPALMKEALREKPGNYVPYPTTTCESDNCSCPSN